MMYNKSLPPEIIIKIFEEVDLKDEEMILQCRLTCKTWNLLMTKQIYHSVDLSTNYLDIFRNKQQNKYKFFIRKIRLDPLVGEMVNNLEVDEWTGYDFRVYVKFCTNLRSFYCYNGCHYYTRLLTELKSGAWRKMNRIQKPVTESDQMLYAEIAWLIRDRLTELYIYEGFLRGLLIEANRPLDEYLASFTKLESIEFLVHGKHIFEFDKYLDDCPRSLSKLNITSLDVGDNDYANRVMRNHLSQITQRPSIKQLGVKLALVNDDSLMYLMHKFPSLFSLELYDTGLETAEGDYGGKLSPQALSSFLHYLSNIRYFNLEDVYMKDACTLLHILINETATRFGAKWRLAIHYQGSRYYDHSHITMVRTEESYVGMELQVIESNIGLPHVTLLENAGQQLERLEFFMGAWYSLQRRNWEFDSEILKMIQGSYISHLFKYCTQLKELEIMQSTILDCGFDSEMKQTRLTYLRLLRCKVCLGVLEELSSHLSSLSTFVIEACEYTSKDNTYVINGGYYTLNMPYTHFQQLKWDIDTCLSYDGFCLRLTDSTGTKKYFKGKLDQFGPSLVKVSKHNAKGYQSYAKSAMKVTIDIYCASIEELEVCINHYIIRIDNQK